MFDWQDLRYFLTAARLGSLTAAAKELGVDHATVGRRIARLEAATGAKLLTRLPRSTRLTEHGVALAEAASAMAAQAEIVVRHLRGRAAGLSGTVTVSALPALAAFVIAPSLPALAETHPGLRITLSATSAIASLERGEADIAIGFVRPELQGRIVRKAGDVSFALYGTSTFSVLPVDEWRFIGFEDSLQDIAQQKWLAAFVGDRPFVLRSNDVVTQANAAHAGIGVALLPCFVGVCDPQLIRLTAECPPARPLWMSVHADLQRSPAVRAVMDHLTTVIATMAHIR